jgi:hypothetical protein
MKKLYGKYKFYSQNNYLFLIIYYNYKMILYIFIYFTIIFLMILKRFYIYYLNKNDNYGEDLGLVDWAKYYKKPFYFSIKLILVNNYNTDIIWNKVKEKISLLIKDKKYNIKYNHDKNKLSEMNIDNIEDICFRKELDFINFHKMIDLHNNNSILVNYLNNEYTFLVDHLVYDGLNVYNNIISQIFDFKKISIRKNIYIPFIYENILILRFIEILFNNLILKKTLISRDSSIQTVVHHDYDINIIKKYKSEYNLKFIDIALSIYCKKVFNSLFTKKNRLNVGLIYALDDKRFRNNYCFFDLYVYNKGLIDMAYDIHKQIEYKKKFIYMQHNIMSSYYYINNFYKSNFDIYFSPMHIKQDEIISFKVSMINILQPLYCYMGTTNNFMSFSTTINCDNINKDEFCKEIEMEIE